MDVWLGVRVLNQAPAGRQAPPWVCRGDGAGVCVVRPTHFPTLLKPQNRLYPWAISHAITLHHSPSQSAR